MAEHHAVNPLNFLALEDIQGLLVSRNPLVLSEEARQRIAHCRSYLDQALDKRTAPVYGINTGFGALCNTVINHDQLEALQQNLLRSHACGTGAAIEPDLVRLMLLLKIYGLSHGHSGVQVETVQCLIDFYNLDILPVVYEQGSLGASGDLAPLSHLALPLIGEGEVFFRGRRMPAAEALRLSDLKPVSLKSKEGLALINGTQFMSAHAVCCLLRAESLMKNALVIAAMSCEGFDARAEPFDALTHQVRAHTGQVNVAAEMRELLKGSQIQAGSKKQVQDPYSFRCIPQVHGASEDVLVYVRGIVEREINSVTDNPLVFADEDAIISGGNFHGQPLALSLDFLAIALAELGSISERRTYKLISGQRDLPPFLARDPGLHSGFMIPHYTAASLVSQNKQLCTPASVDTIDSSNGQEDHVSMGANAATKTWRVLNNLQQIMAIEWLTAAQALDFRRPSAAGPRVEDFHKRLRSAVPFLAADEWMQPLMEKARLLLNPEWIR